MSLFIKEIAFWAHAASAKIFAMCWCEKEVWIPVQPWHTSLEMFYHDINQDDPKKTWEDSGGKFVYLTNLLAVGSTSNPNASRMMHRINVIASTTVSPLFPTFRVFKSASSTERSTAFISDWCEICVARRSILRSKSGAFNMSCTAVTALGSHVSGAGRWSTLTGPSSSKPGSGYY